MIEYKKIYTEEELQVIVKKYELAMDLCEIELFEVDIATSKVTLLNESSYAGEFGKYLCDAPNKFSENNFLSQNARAELGRIKSEIKSGKESAECSTFFIDENANEHKYDVKLINVFSGTGEPVKIIGGYRDVKTINELRRDNRFANNFLRDRILLCEANLTDNKVLSIDKNIHDMQNGIKDISYDLFFKNLLAYAPSKEWEDKLIEELSLNSLLCNKSSSENNFVLQCKLFSMDKDKAIWCELSATIIKENINNKEQVILRLYLKDINEEKNLEILMQKQKEIYASMLSNKAVISYEMNLTKDNFVHGNEKWLEENNVDSSTSYSEAINKIAATKVHPDDASYFINSIGRNNLLLGFASGEEEFLCEYRRYCNKGVYIWWECQIRLYQDPSTQDVRGFVYLKKTHEEKEAQLALEYDAMHDAMTGLYNKAFTEAKIKESLLQASKEGHVNAFVIIDLDNFKQINDTFGHDFGDEVLKEFAGNIKSAFRSNDIVGRIGGDEFCVMAQNIKQHEILLKKARELCARLEKTYEKDGEKRSVSASIGVAFTDTNTYDYTALFKSADGAMYRVKKSGKKSVST